MGRVKLKIKKLESISNRHVTYSKRKSGILKKAKELSILCDIDILLLMFSPTGKPTLLQGERSNIEEVVAKFAQLSPQERAKSYSNYIGSNKLEVGSSPQVTLGQGGGAMNELNGTTYLNVQRCDQFTFPPQDIEEAKHLPTLNNKSNTVDYQVNNFDLSGSLFENEHQFWNSASGSCGIAMYNENGYHRPFWSDKLLADKMMTKWLQIMSTKTILDCLSTYEVNVVVYQWYDVSMGQSVVEAQLSDINPTIYLTVRPTTKLSDMNLLQYD
ncbi:Agamous-like MADS-box protein [Vigna angularis]|uniref:Agamous-like MADS-box protein n=1 Tax=Phaseolus angularis TaxID=3914 RepID=A0A8T0LBZ8_PHAAN|nr:Agamous-like MADS-box protein [Vigna angularis]